VFIEEARGRERESAVGSKTVKSLKGYVTYLRNGCLSLNFNQDIKALKYCFPGLTE